MKYIKPLFLLGTAFALLTASLVTRTNLSVQTDTHYMVAFGEDNGPIVPVNPYSVIIPQKNV